MFPSGYFISLIYFLPLFHGLFGTYELEIFSSTKTNLSHIDESINNTLELTCHLNGYHKGLNVYLSWHLPKYNANRMNAVLNEDMNGSLKLTLNQLNEKDSGEYICGAVIDQDTFYNKSIIVHVRQKRCGLNMFECAPPSSGRCIHQRYVCDGKEDCESGVDESPALCGDEVCKGKIVCDTGRCIPSSWCCHPLETNCTVKVRLPCCPPLPGDDYLYHHNILNNQHYTEMNFLQSTIYTIVGFAMVFMSIVSILMICICRIHLQRSIVSSVPRRQPTTPSHSTASRACIYNNRQGSSRMLVSYSIPSNDLEIVGDICQPPPYSEVTSYSDPPPSYKDIFCNRPNEDSETSPCLSSEKPPP